MPFSNARRMMAMAALVAVTISVSGAGYGPGDAVVADAMMQGDTALVRLLVSQGADVNAAQADGMTALHWAASRGDAARANMLIVSGARVGALTRNGNYTPLHLAAKNGRADVARALIAAGADVMAVTTSGGATVLHFAAANGDAATVDAVLAGGARVDEREDAWSQTPLMWAAAYNRADAIKVLLKAGARIEAVSRIEDVPALERDTRAKITARTRRLAALKAADAPTPAAAAGGRAGAAPAAAGGAPPSARPPAATPSTATPPAATPPSATPPTTGAATGATGAPGVRMGPGAGPATPARARTAAASATTAATTPATPAAGSDTARPAPQQRAINRGPSYGELIGNKGGLTALLFAVRDGNFEAMMALLDAGAKVNHVSEGDHTSPLLMATINGRFDMAKVLLDKGANVKLASDAGATPLYATINVQWAAKSLYPQPTAQLQQHTSYLELMEALLKAGADPNVRLTKHLWYMSYNFDLLGVNTAGATPFWRAAYGTDVDAMKLLVRYGADPTIPTFRPVGRLPGDDAPAEDDGAPGKDPSGLPPIPEGGPGVYPLLAAAGVGYGEGYAANSHRHAPDGWLPSMKYLIEELHTDVNLRDHNGYNAIHHAAARGDNELIEYLVAKGVDVTALSRRGQTTADMANGPVQRIPPFLETVALLEKLGSKNSNKCRSC